MIATLVQSESRKVISQSETRKNGARENKTLSTPHQPGKYFHMHDLTRKNGARGKIRPCPPANRVNISICMICNKRK